MTIKKCSKCGFSHTTKTVMKKGRDEFGLYFNCLEIDPKDGKVCNGTMFLRRKDWMQILKAAS